jgi:flavin-dependent dehydrogenase
VDAGAIPHDGFLKIWYDRAIRPGYAWAFPVSATRVNTGAGVLFSSGRKAANLRSVHEAFLESNGYLRRVTDGADWVGGMLGAPMRANLGGAATALDRTLVVGEAAGTTYALSGEGIGKAMETGALAAEILADLLRRDELDRSRLERYSRWLEASFRHKFDQYEKGQRWAKCPRVLDQMVKRAAKSTSLRRILEEILEESRDPTEILSLRGIVGKMLLVG